MQGLWFRLPLMAAALALTSPVAARPLVVDRIVAIVDEGLILLSELRARARPFKTRVDEAGLSPEKRAAAEAQIESELLERMIDERVLAREAARVGLVVAEEEVTHAMDTVAGQSSITREAVLAAAAKQGLDEASYRAELRRQLLEGKLLYLKLSQKERQAPEAAAAALEAKRREMISSLRARAFVEVRR